MTTVEQETAEGTARRTLRRAAFAVLWIVIGLGTLVLAASVAVPRVFGASPYTILTGSMRPHMPPGTLVLIRPTDPKDLGTGNVVTYQLKSGEPAVVTHRIVGVGYDSKGHKVFTTQGNANPTPDPLPVRTVQIRGRLWYAVPYAGWAGQVLTASTRQILFNVLVFGLFAYALSMVVASHRDGLRKRRCKPAEDRPGHLRRRVRHV